MNKNDLLISSKLLHRPLWLLLWGRDIHFLSDRSRFFDNIAFNTQSKEESERVQKLTLYT